MSAACRTRIAAWTLCTVLGVPAAIAGDAGARADASGAMPGDDALTCDQIYAQGMAQSRRDQEERAKASARQKAQVDSLAALAVTADTVGQLDPSHTAARATQKTAEAQADQTLAMLGRTPQPDPRLVHLKQLWAQKQCVSK